MHLNNEISKSIKDFITRSQQYRDNYTPVFYRINNLEEEIKLNNLLTEKPFIQVYLPGVTKPPCKVNQGKETDALAGNEFFE